MPYKLHLNLQQRAALRIAISFWEKIEVKDKVREFFKSCEKSKIDKTEKKWDKLTKVILEEWEKDVLPQKLEIELVHIIKMIGETIFNWYQYIKREYETKKNPINCIDKIHWTPYGTVDAVKIFKSSWLDNPNFDIFNTYNFACRYVIEDCINHLWDKMPCDIRNCYDDDIYGCFDQHIIAYWNCCKDDDLLNLMRYFEEGDFSREDMREFTLIYDLNISIQENMLRLSVHQAYFIATKYFWEKLTEEERSENVLKCARLIVRRFYYYKYSGKRIRGYKVENCVEICIFLMNQMSAEHKGSFFNEKLGPDNSSYINDADVKDEILHMLLSVWPWQELFMPILEDMLKYQDHNRRMECIFLDEITNRMFNDHNLGYSVKTSKYRSLLFQVWLIFPLSIKQKIIEVYSELQFISNLVFMGDWDSLKLIINDPEIATVRDKFIELGSYSYERLIVNDQFERLDQFIDEIFSSNENKKQFKEKIDVWQPLMNRGLFDLADKYLDWRCSTPEDRQSTKNNIDHTEFCENFIEWDDYETLDELLDWKFDTEEEKRKCKDYYKSNAFSIRRICVIWKDCKKNINQAKEKCSEFLQWFLESEEEIVLFKKEMLDKFENDQFTMYLLSELQCDGMIDYFISWCLLNDEQFLRFQQIKQAVSQWRLH